MKLIYFILTCSFILEGIVSNFVSVQTELWNPLFSLITLISIYPCFKNDKKYYKICLIYGMLYDLIYTNTLVFHGLLFLCAGYLVHHLYKLFSLNIVNIVALTFIIISTYRILSYILLCLVSNYSFSWLILLRSITSSLVLNIIYILVLHLILQRRYHSLNL